MKKVYVLGAGFSRDAGLPLISDFHDEEFQNILAKNIRKRKDNLTRFNQAINVLNFFYDNYIVNDIEDALSHLSCAKFLDMTIDIDGVKSIYPETNKKNLEWLIVQAVSLKGKRIPKFYKDFFSNVIKGKSTILYFNYDLLPERAVKKHGKEFDYGFSDEYSIKRGKLPLLLKLHGSADWLYCDNCGLQISYGQEVAIKIASNNMKCPECKRNHGLSPVIIPPIIGKEDLFIKYKACFIIRC